MAHQTGIKPSGELTTLMADALHGKLRMLQVTIDQSTEELVPGAHRAPNDTWENDYDSFILSSLEDKSACYIFYRLDERNAHDMYLWIFLMYTPDEAPVREKMLYSATKATLKKAFNSAVMIDDMSATSKEEISLQGYRKHVEAANAPPPLTREEHEWKEILEAEDHVDVGTTTRQSHLHGVSFPLHEDAMSALRDMQGMKVQYIHLTIDLDNELIILEDAADQLGPDDIDSRISDTTPGYHLYLFKHTHEGDYQESFVFIYACPGYKSTVKERMIYSSCKSPLASALKNIGINIEKKIEVDGSDNINEGFLMNELHPIKQAHRTQFDKPKPPAARRPAANKR